MKKNLITLAAASLMLAACGNNNSTPKTYSVHVIEDERATITIDQLEDYNKGDLVSFTVTLGSEEYVLDSVTVANFEESSKVVETTKSATAYYFMMPDFDVSISVVTSVKEYTIELSQEPDVTLSLVGITNNKAVKGATVTVSATINNPEVTLEEVNVSSKMDPTVSVNVTKGADNNYTFVMPNYDVYVGTLTSAIRYGITLEPDSYSSITCHDETAPAGKTVTFIASSLSNTKRVSSVSVKTAGGDPVVVTENGNSYSFVMPSEAVSIKSETEDIEFAININPSENFNVSVVGEYDSCIAGTNVVLSVVPTVSSVKVKEVKVKCGNDDVAVQALPNDEYSFVMPAGDVTVTVVEESATNSVTVSNNPNATVTIDGGKTEFAPGDEVSFSVTAKSGYSVESVSVKTATGKTVSYQHEESYSFVMPDEAVVISVTTVGLYSVTVNSDSYTQVSFATVKESYKAGENVSFTVAVTDSEYELDSVEVKNGTSTVATTSAGGTYSFVMPAGNVVINTKAKAKSSEKTDPFTSPVAYQGTYYYHDFYDEVLMRLRVVFSGSGKLSWYLTYEYEDYGDEYYAPALRSKPSNMPGTEKASGENITYTYDATNDQIKFNTKIKTSYKDVIIQINRNGDNVASINFTESLSGDFYDCGTTKLFKI